MKGHALVLQNVQIAMSTTGLTITMPFPSERNRTAPIKMQKFYVLCGSPLKDF